MRIAVSVSVFDRMHWLPAPHEPAGPAAGPPHGSIAAAVSPMAAVGGGGYHLDATAEAEDVRLWDLYFPGREYDPQLEGVSKKFLPFFRRPGISAQLSEGGVLRFKFTKLMEGCAEVGLPIQEGDVVERPEDFLGCMELAAHRALLQGGDGGCPARRIFVRMVEMPTVTKLKRLKAHRKDKLFCVKGTVVRVGGILPLVTRMSFECAKCGNTQSRVFTAGRYNPPTSCGVNGCRSRSFEPDREGAASVDWQKVRLQEIIDDDKEAGRIPRTVDVELTNDLVDSCVPGDVVTVCGIVRSLQTQGQYGARDKAKTLFYLCVTLSLACVVSASAAVPSVTTLVRHRRGWLTLSSRARWQVPGGELDHQLQDSGRRQHQRRGGGGFLTGSR
jgi:hypothetical protein